MHILIVEDEALIALSMEGVLQRAGHTVIGVASTIKATLGIVDKECPDLALLDINLGEDRGAGIDLARHLLERNGVPSLFVSGQMFEARAHRDAALGYLGKPYSSRTLLASIEIARQIIKGEERNLAPSGLEIFDGPKNAPRHQDSENE